MRDIDRIIEYMKNHKGITCKECEREIGTTELRRRMCDMREMGYTLDDVWEDGENRVGHPTRYKRYFLISAPSEPKKLVYKRKKKKPEQKSFWEWLTGIKKLTAKTKKRKIK